MSVTATDAACNSSPVSTRSLTVDTAKPDAPTVTAPAANEATSDTTPTFKGTGEPVGTVVVKHGDVVLCTATVDRDGNWSCTPSSLLDDGDLTVSITLADAAGNVSDLATRTFTIDTAEPAKPAMTAPAADAPVSGKPSFEGTAEPGSTVTVTVDRDGDPNTTDDIIVFTTTADENGN